MRENNSMLFLDWGEWWFEYNKYGRAVPYLDSKRANDPGFRKLNLGCGSLAYNPENGWVNLDLNSGPGITVHNIYDMPWPFADGEFDYIHMSNILEHICQSRFWEFFDELNRVSKDGTIWEIHGPDPRNIVVTLQAPSHTTLVGPWTFQGFVNRVETGALDIGKKTEKFRLEPLDLVYHKNRPVKWHSWHGFYFWKLSDWHFRRYLGRRLADPILKIIGKPWTLRMTFRVRKSD